MDSKIKRKNALPGFRDYIHEKYPELDEDLVTMMEDLIEREKEKEARKNHKGVNNSSAPDLKPSVEMEI